MDKKYILPFTIIMCRGTSGGKSTFLCTVLNNYTSRIKRVRRWMSISYLEKELRFERGELSRFILLSNEPSGYLQTFGDCCENQIPCSLRRCKLDTPLLAVRLLADIINVQRTFESNEEVHVGNNYKLWKYITQHNLIKIRGDTLCYNF